MAIQFIEESTLTAMADAIRVGTGKAGKMKPSEMPGEIAAIKTYSREGKYVWSVQSGDGTTVDANAETKYVASNDKAAYPTDGWIDSDYFKLVKKPDVKIVSWAGGTDEEICAMVEAADKGDINLADYWSVGDTRQVQLSAMAATGVGESHAAQSVELVLIHAGGKDLVTATESGRTTCSFVVGLKDCLNEAGYMNSANTNAKGWDGCARRTWCNSVFRNAIPSPLRGIFKQHKNKAFAGGSTIKTSNDYFALPAEIEVFGTRSYSASGEGSQFKYYETTSNRIKNINGSAANWWERSPYRSNSVFFCLVSSKGVAFSLEASSTYGLVPFGCI